MQVEDTASRIVTHAAGAVSSILHEQGHPRIHRICRCFCGPTSDRPTDRLAESDRTLLAESLPMRQVPFLRYCTNKGTQEYIAFADASAGQQATALLTVLLNQIGHC